MVRLFGVIEWAAMLASAAVALLVLSASQYSFAFQPVMVVLTLLIAGWISARDIRDFIIPDGAIIGLLLLALAVNLAHAESAWAVASFLLNAAVCGGALLLVREVFYRRRGFDGLGFGDVKLGAVCGAWIGLEGFAWAVFIASAAGLATVALLSVLRPKRKIDRLPFGALLAPACWLLWVSGLPGAPP